MIERPPPPADAGISLLGIYGLANPTIVWLLNKRPDLLAETPGEFQAPPGGSAPACNWFGRYDGLPDAYEAYCRMPMTLRYLEGRMVWACYRHFHSVTGERYVHTHEIERPRPKLTQEPTFDLWAEIGHALEGKSRDLVFDEGRWRLVEHV